ncbi:MAG: protein rep [Desulfobacula sp.]|jgi:hypothetical protein|nr:protein rep [Desulfobacula sp.]
MQDSELNQVRIENQGSDTDSLQKSESGTPLGIYANKWEQTWESLLDKAFQPETTFEKNPQEFSILDLFSVIDRIRKPSRHVRWKISNYFTKSDWVLKRVRDCGKSLGLTEIWKDKKGSARVGKVETCGSVHNCPICRVNIKAKRQKELKKINDGFTEERKKYSIEVIGTDENGLFIMQDEKDLPGGNCSMITFTVQHNYSDRMLALLGYVDSKSSRNTNKKNQGIIGALRRLRASKFWKQFKETIAYVADVRVLETTIGKSGFHVHIHMLVFHKREIDHYEIKKKLFDQWSISSLASGLRQPDARYGVDIKNADKASDYLVKWGADSEIMSDSAKKAKNGNYTIPQFEKLLVDEESRIKSGYEIEQIERILSEYQKAMFGKRLVQWSGNHKKLKEDYCQDYEENEKELAKLDYSEVKELQALVRSPLWNKWRWRGVLSVIRTIIETKGKPGLIEFVKRYYPSQLRELITSEEVLNRYCSRMADVLEKITKSKEKEE